MSTCYAVPNPYIQPAMRLIHSITNASPALVTTTFDHQYLSGTIVRLDIPVACGMQEADKQYGPIVVTSPTTFNFPLDTTYFTPFAIPVAPDPHENTCAMVIPIGEISQMLDAATQNVLP